MGLGTIIWWLVAIIIIIILVKFLLGIIWTGERYNETQWNHINSKMRKKAVKYNLFFFNSKKKFNFHYLMLIC